MQVCLNMDKCTMLILGVNPGFLDSGDKYVLSDQPMELDPSRLNPATLRQLIFNINRGYIETDEDGKKELQDVLVKQAPPEQKVAAAEVVKPERKLNPVQVIQNELEGLETVLRATIPTIIKECAGFRVAKLRRLKELEEEGQKRVTLLKFLAQKIEDHNKVVSQSVGDEDVGGKYAVHAPGLVSSQVSEIVESDIVQVTIKNGAQDDKAPGVSP